MKLLWLTPLFAALITSSAAQDYPHFGSFHGSVYSNREFGMQLHVPNGWTIAAPTHESDDPAAPVRIYFSLSQNSAPNTLILFKGVKFDGTPSISADRSKSYADTFSDRPDLTVTRDATRTLMGGIDMYRTDLRSTDADQPLLTLLTVAIRDRIRIFEIHSSSQHELDDTVALLATHVFFDPDYRAADLKSTPPVATVVNKSAEAESLLRDATPVYPDQAKAAHVTGSLSFNVEFSKSGHVQRIWLVDESESLSAPTEQIAHLQPLFVESALTQLQKLKFTPPKRNGSPIPGLTPITVTFAIN